MWKTIWSKITNFFSGSKDKAVLSFTVQITQRGDMLYDLKYDEHYVGDIATLWYQIKHGILGEDFEQVLKRDLNEDDYALVYQSFQTINILTNTTVSKDEPIIKPSQVLIPRQD